tara:strand:- start:243 stop:803 length:561 start_codon:yes stop_codon:yes gene_type:complete
MSLVQPINCQQSVEQYCIYGNGGEYASITDCIQNRPCEPETFAKCGDDFNDFTYRRKKVYAKYLGIPISEIDNYWEETPEEELSTYNVWNETCEYNAQSLHNLSLQLEPNLSKEDFFERLSKRSNEFTKYFTGKYPDEFYRTYTTQRIPSSTTSVEQEEEDKNEINKKYLIIGAIALGFGLSFLNK